MPPFVDDDEFQGREEDPILDELRDELREATLAREELRAETARVTAENVVARKALCDLRAAHAEVLREMKASKGLLGSRTRALAKMREQLSVQESGERQMILSSGPRYSCCVGAPPPPFGCVVMCCYPPPPFFPFPY